MSKIKNRPGIPYLTKTDTIPGCHGHPIRVSRYWLNTEAQVKARELIHTMRRRRGLGVASE